MYRAVAKLSVIGLLTGGCSFVDVQRNSSLSYQNVTINQQVWAAIMPGVTDEQWLLQHIGPPASIEQQKNERVFVYPLMANTASSTQVFLLYSKREVSESPLQKRIYLSGKKVTRVETRYPEPPVVAMSPGSDASADAPSQLNTVNGKAASDAQMPASPDADPYAHGNKDPFEHPWPLNRSL